MVCFPHVLSAFLIRLGAPGGKNSIKATSSAWPRDPYTQVKPPALPTPQPGDAGLTRCLSMSPGGGGRVSCERGVLPSVHHPGEGQALTEETGTLLGRIQGATPSLQTAFGAFPGGATARKQSEARLSHCQPQIQSKALLRSPAGLQGCPGSEGKRGGKAQSRASMGKQPPCLGDGGQECPEGPISSKMSCPRCQSWRLWVILQVKRGKVSL